MSIDKLNYVSTTYLATCLGVSRQTIFRKIKDKKISAIKVGKNFKIPMSEAKRIKKEGV